MTFEEEYDPIDIEDYLSHYGRKGMKWYQHIFGDDNSKRVEGRKEVNNDEDLKKDMEDIEYSEFSLLKSPQEVKKSKKGSCHDQVMYELDELRKRGYEPKAGFIMEYDPETYQGGMTHSFVYYNDNGKFKWFENSWGGRKGIHTYNSEKELLNDVEKKFRSESNYPEIEMTDFGNHIPGEDLQELVNKSLSNKKLKHSEEDIEDYLVHYGRKGMKWYEHIFGRLQTHAKYAKGKSSGNARTKSTSSNKEKVKNVARKNHKKLSEEELKSRIDRLKIEKEYLDLTRDTRTKGKKIVDSVLGSIGKGALRAIEDQTKNLGNNLVGELIKELNKKDKKK